MSDEISSDDAGASDSPGAAAATSDAPLLVCRAITKRFGGSVALDRVDFDIATGEVHGLVGSNGAGKSTLMKVLAGAMPDYEGQISLNDAPVALSSPAAAGRLGIAMVHQELSGVGQLSVAENLFLGRQPTTRLGRINWRRMNTEARRQLAELDIDVDVTARLDTYPLVVRQMVEIARGLHSGARLLILDEPTSALSPPETRRLLELIGRLSRRGVACVFISHFIEDVLEVCDRVTVLRDGRVVETRATSEVDKHELVHTMLGHGLDGEEVGYETAAQLPPRHGEPPILVARNLARPREFTDVDLEVAPGECLCLYGFMGAGHQALAHTLAAANRPSSGKVTLDGSQRGLATPRQAIRRGVVLVTADRAQSVFARAAVYQNVTLAHLRATVGNWLTRRRERRVAAPAIQRVGCRPRDPDLPAGSLSGGNQQKVVMARWLLGPMRVLVLEEPTRGMDVGAKEEVMQLVHEAQAAGAAVILATTEPELALAHADRILVMRRGRITHEFCGESVDKPTLMAHAG
ncbi:MAG: sugar ABC transporter ATP-binding protein [Planctomycetales bacterium]|nr:sugar ABC transporter ATP-binding protein [Planctomycetales bacterium]